MFTLEFLTDRGNHLAAKLQKTKEALYRDGLLNAARLYKLEVLIPQIIAAQNRLIEGTYGYCTDCDEEIQKERLLKHPHVARCVECQGKQERRKF